MRKNVACTIALAGGLAGLLAAPALHLAIVTANFLVHLAVLGLQLVTSRLAPPQRPRSIPLEREPFVSIQIPAYNEPPGMLRRTLRALSRLKWQN